MANKYNFKHGIYEYIGCASEYHKGITRESSADYVQNELSQIQACKTIARGWLDAIVSAGVEISSWFTLADATKLLSESDFDWRNPDKFNPWYESFFQKYRVEIITSKLL